MLMCTGAHATENGGSVYPVGAETVLQGMLSPPKETGLHTFHFVYTPNEMDDGSGKSEVPDFKLRVFANAIKIEHNWGVPVLGGMLESTVGVPFVYEGLRITTGQNESEKYNKFGLGNVMLVPLGVTYARGNWHWFYQGDLFLPGAPYSKTAAINIGQHNFAAGPTGAFTYLSNKAKWEASSKVDCIFNFKDGATSYRSGNELTWEFTGMRAISKKAAVGFNGYLYQQLTDDQSSGVPAGNRGRDLAVGPEFRYFFAEHKAFALKYTRDTLVENKPRGNSFWFQVGLPLSFGGKK
jgi:hypothetical protein